MLHVACFGSNLPPVSCSLPQSRAEHVVEFLNEMWRMHILHEYLFLTLKHAVGIGCRDMQVACFDMPCLNFAANARHK
jgi:hypothetical protein